MLFHLLRRRGIEPVDALVDPNDLAAYRQRYEATEGNCEPCTTIDDFICDVAGTPKLIWNKSAGRVFARHVVVDVLHRSDNEENVDEVAEAFHTRLKTLRYERSQKYRTCAQIAQAESMARHDGKKYKVRFLCLSIHLVRFMNG